MKKLLTYCSLLTVCSFPAMAQQLTLGHSMNTENAAHQGMLVFAEKVKEKSNGKLTVRIIPNGLLGSEREQAEQVVTGAIDMAKINGSLAESFEPSYKVISLPFLFNDTQHMRQFMFSDLAQELLDSSKNKGKGFIGLTFYDSGSRSFYSKKPIKTPADLAGMKVRVPESPTMMEMINLLGAKSTPMPFNEIYTGLQQGVIDAAENNIPSLVEMRHSEVAKYYSVDQHTMAPDVIIISEATWSKLDDSHRALLKEAAQESLEEQIKIWDASENMNTSKAKELGVTFVEVDKESFKNKVKPMIDAAAADQVLGYYVKGIQQL